jgi:hypothetical protein
MQSTVKQKNLELEVEITVAEALSLVHHGEIRCHPDGCESISIFLESVSVGYADVSVGYEDVRDLFEGETDKIERAAGRDGTYEQPLVTILADT